MIFRDLTDEQGEELKKEVLELMKRRKQSNHDLNELQYKLAVSDGMRIILKRLDYLPDAK